ncbi:hypothetical protein FO519_006109 [Halicephalobus sp. NKZ332]|nr:hypothetical protein FO519_006109 [Halicephalobus sp. NKZ332]
MTQGYIIGDHDGDEVTHRRQWVDRRDCQKDSTDDSPHEFLCTHLVHYTENEFAGDIGLEDPDYFSFKISEWTSIANLRGLNVTWWSPLPPRRFDEIIERNTPNMLRKYKYMEDGKLTTVLGNSPAFRGDSICGPIGFSISWKDILNQYAENRGCDRNEVQLRVLGTFRYRSEIMYAVLVCTKGQ